MSTSPGAAPRPAPHALRMMSLFTVVPPEPPTFQIHDLVQIIVRETSQTSSSQDLDTKKDWKLDAKVSAWPSLRLSDILQLQIPAGTTPTPQAKIESKKNFDAEADYGRKDDFSARITAEIIEVMPNGNLVLEARTTIQTDREVNKIRVTGICRPADVSPTNTVLSNQIHDLVVNKMHEGDLPKNTEKGILAKLLDAVFAF